MKATIGKHIVVNDPLVKDFPELKEKGGKPCSTKGKQ